jgi:hypothetical protein
MAGRKKLAGDLSRPDTMKGKKRWRHRKYSSPMMDYKVL